MTWARRRRSQPRSGVSSSSRFLVERERRPVAHGGGAIVERHPRAVTGPHEPIERLGRASLLEMAGDHIGVGARQRRQRRADPAMPRPPTRRQDILVDRVVNQRVAEPHPRAINRRLQDTRGLRLFEHIQQFLVIRPGQRGPEGERRDLADHRRHRQQRLRRRAEAGDASVDHLPQQRRDTHRADIADLPGTHRLAQHPLLLQRPQEFAQVERVALRTPLQVVHQPRRVGRGQGGACGDESVDGSGRERVEFDAGGPGLPDQQREEGGEGVFAGDLVGAVGADDQQRMGVGGAGDGAQEFEAESIGPVEIVEQQQERSDGGQGGAPIEHLLDERPLAGAVANRAARGEGRGQRGQVVGRQIAPEEVHPGAVGRGLGQVVGASDQDQRPSRRRFLGQRLGQRRLPDPRLAAD